MNEKMKDFGGKVKEQIGKVNKKTRTLIIIALIVLVIAAVVIAVILNNQPYTVLFTGMGGEEFSSVLSYLEQNGVRNYHIQNNDTVLVPRDQESRLKAQLLMAGYPNTGFSYESYYEHVGALSTESERNRTYFMALEERMGAVIRCLDGVKEAVVTIAQGENRSYVLDSNNVVNATASVIVTMKNGASLNDDIANAIRRLVARAVQGLDIESVDIVDNIGNTYSASYGTGEVKDASQLKLQLEESANNKVRTEVMRVLSNMFGEENVDVGVHCTVQVDKGISESTTYELPEWAADGSTNGEGIIGSKVYNDVVIRRDGDGAGGTVGTTTNADLPTYIENTMQVDGDEREINTSGQKDYLVDTYKEYIERTTGRITDCTVAVSINSTTAGSVNIPVMRDHVAKAAGISAVATETMTADEYLSSKISIVTMPFFVRPNAGNDDGSTTTEPAIPRWVIYAAIGGAVLFLILLILIIVLRKRSKKKKEAALAALAEGDQQAILEGLLAAAAEQEPTGADVMSMETEKSMELRKEIRKFADSNPEITAQMVKALLKGGEERA